MKIHSDEPVVNLNSPRKSSSEVKSSKEQDPKSTACDCVQLSARAHEFNRIKEIVDKTPDVRQDAVDRLRGALQAGEYKPDSHKTSDALIRESLLDLFA